MKHTARITLILSLISSGSFVHAVKPSEQEALEWALLSAGLNTGRQLLLTWQNKESEDSEASDDEMSSSSEEDSELEALYERCHTDAEYEEGLNELIAREEARAKEQGAALEALQAKLAALQTKSSPENSKPD